MKAKFTIIKYNHLGKEVIRYPGELLEREENQIQLQARFGLENIKLVDIPLEVGDLFLETYYRHRWYNIYEIHARQDNKLKGWYCNVSYPADIGNDMVTFRDLALDLLVYPGGRQTVLDEDEFAALDIAEPDRVMALAALAELRRLFDKKFAK